eukprot:TRINITY_DN66350_c7_g3_i1.p1 TRINITY_DN66350_c7_g3~~TRINITY_DN66350_c7_g3_i1.p1  ORF type:complete len:1064 (-),score=649.38 TRINITY_DN66350_c7_g3_i1:1809-5000(-)
MGALSKGGCCAVGLGLLLLIASVGLSRFVMQSAVDGVSEAVSVRKEQEDPEAYAKWKTTDRPDAGSLHWNFYVYNYTNVGAFFDSKDVTPVVKEVGPYRYREYVEKFQVGFSDGDKKVEYNQWSYFKRDPAPEAVAAGYDAQTDNINSIWTGYIAFKGALQQAGFSGVKSGIIKVADGMQKAMGTPTAAGVNDKIFAGFFDKISGMLKNPTYGGYASLVFGGYVLGLQQTYGALPGAAAAIADHWGNNTSGTFATNPSFANYAKTFGGANNATRFTGAQAQGILFGTQGLTSKDTTDLMGTNYPAFFPNETAKDQVYSTLILLTYLKSGNNAATTRAAMNNVTTVYATDTQVQMVVDYLKKLAEAKEATKCTDTASCQQQWAGQWASASYLDGSSFRDTIPEPKWYPEYHNWAKANNINNVNTSIDKTLAWNILFGPRGFTKADVNKTIAAAVNVTAVLDPALLTGTETFGSLFSTLMIASKQVPTLKGAAQNLWNVTADQIDPLYNWLKQVRPEVTECATVQSNACWDKWAAQWATLDFNYGNSFGLLGEATGPKAYYEYEAWRTLVKKEKTDKGKLTVSEAQVVMNGDWGLRKDDVDGNLGFLQRQQQGRTGEDLKFGREVTRGNAFTLLFLSTRADPSLAVQLSFAGLWFNQPDPAAVTQAVKDKLQYLGEYLLYLDQTVVTPTILGGEKQVLDGLAAAPQNFDRVVAFNKSQAPFMTRKAESFLLNWVDPLLQNVLSLNKSTAYFTNQTHIGVITDKDDIFKAADETKHTLWTGKDAPEKSGQYVKWNSWDVIPNTSPRPGLGGWCVEPIPVSGTTGRQFAPAKLVLGGVSGSTWEPRISKDGQIEIMNSEIIRPIKLDFVKEVEVKGVKAWRYKLEDSALDPDPKFDQKFRGLGNLSCPKGLPIYVCKPHYKDVDWPAMEGSFDTKVELPPVDPELNEVFVDVEPNSGATIRGFERMQINVAYKLPGRANATLFPILYISKNGLLSDKNAKDLKDAYDTVDQVQMATAAGTAGGAVFLLAGLICCVCGRKKTGGDKGIELDTVGDDGLPDDDDDYNTN